MTLSFVFALFLFVSTTNAAEIPIVTNSTVHADIVDEAVNIITQYFAANPSEEFYSLGVNDIGGHCECSECLARINGKLNSIGLPDYSDIYYEWCNAVATGVLAEYPDKRLGLLAYSEVYDPPSFPLDASIVTWINWSFSRSIRMEFATLGGGTRLHYGKLHPNEVVCEKQRLT